MYSNGGIQPFHGIHMDWSMESIWTGSWNPYGLVHGIDRLVHGIHMEWKCNPYGMDHSMTIPYGFHGAYGMRKWLGPQPKVIPYKFHGMADGFHGFHMHSIWNNPGRIKTSIFSAYLRLPSVGNSQG